MSLRLLNRLIRKAEQFGIKLSEIKLSQESLEKLKADLEKCEEKTVKWFHQEIAYGEMLLHGLYRDIKLIPKGLEDESNKE